MSQFFLFGNKEIFAVELTTDDNICEYGVIRIWINGKCLGDDDTAYIKPNLIALARVKNLSRFEQLNVLKKRPGAVFKRIVKTDFFYSETLLGLGETFDKYILRLFIYDQYVVFIWVCSGRRNNELNCEIVPFMEFYGVLTKCQEIVDFNLPDASSYSV